MMDKGLSGSLWPQAVRMPNVHQHAPTHLGLHSPDLCLLPRRVVRCDLD